MIKIVNWSSYQSYKDRKPPWIRLHKSLLDNYEFQTMSDSARSILPMLWLMASEAKDPTSGIIDKKIEVIAFRLRQNSEKVKSSIKELASNNFIIILDSYENVTKFQDSVTPETETETETENTLSGLQPDAVFLDNQKTTKNFKQEALEILEFLNFKTGRNFKDSKTNLDFILSKLKDGATKKECKQIIAMMCRKWMGDEKMSDYLRPATLFNKTNFEQYRGLLAQRAPESERKEVITNAMPSMS